MNARMTYQKAFTASEDAQIWALLLQIFFSTLKADMVSISIGITNEVLYLRQCVKINNVIVVFHL